MSSRRPQCSVSAAVSRHQHTEVPRARDPTTSFLTPTTLIYATGAGITAAAGTALAFRKILVEGSNVYPFHSSDLERVPIASFRHCLPRVIGSFACLLSSLGVVAVSHAPSPESNPDSILQAREAFRALPHLIDRHLKDTSLVRDQASNRTVSPKFSRLGTEECDRSHTLVFI